MKPTFGKGLQRESFLCYLVMFFAGMICMLPVLMVISTSFSSNSYVTKYGYSFLPHEPTMDTYIFLVGNKLRTIFRAYGISFFVTIVGTLFSLTLETLYSYAVAQDRDTFYFAQPLSFIAWFTTIFSGGVLPWYIVCTKYVGLKNNLWAWIIPGAFGVFHMFILKNGFKSIPGELIESARIDGASNSRIFRRIALPLTRSAIVTIALFNVLGHWNSFYNGQYLITKSKLYNMQQLLYSLMGNASAMLQNSGTESILDKIELPVNTVKSAITCLTILPIVILYPFSLKFFIKGINVGAVKG